MPKLSQLAANASRKKSKIMRVCGGIGIRATLKMSSLHWGVGSTPTKPTTSECSAAVAHSVWDRGVVSSNLTTPTKFRREVGGSSPPSPTRHAKRKSPPMATTFQQRRNCCAISYVARVAQWQSICFPSRVRGFDSLLSLKIQ